MTKPNLDEKLTAMMKDYVREKWGGSRAPRMVHYCETYFMAGAAAAENAARAINGQLGEALDRVAELTEALEFYAERRLYVNVGLQNDLYTDAGKRARQALGRKEGDE